MPRPNKPKRVRSLPICERFMPEKGSCTGHEILMAVEEYETLRLIDYQGLTQEECARKMGVGRATVQAMYTEARKKTARFLAEAATLRIHGGNYCLGEQEEMDIGGRGADKMKIAVTYENGQVYQHFGHTEQFKIYDTEDGKILNSEIVDTNGTRSRSSGRIFKRYGGRCPYLRRDRRRRQKRFGRSRNPSLPRRQRRCGPSGGSFLKGKSQL